MKMNFKPMVARLRETDTYQRLIGGPPDTAGIKSGHVVLAPGKAVGEHVTQGKEEIVIVLRGEGEITCGEAGPLKLGPGTVAYVPPETAHDVRNTSGSVLEYIYVTSPVK